MKKSDLKTGMLIIHRNNEMSLVMLGTPNGDNLVGDGRDKERLWLPLDNILNDLNHSYGRTDHDIIEVWSYGNNQEGARFSTIGRRLLWKREENIFRMKLNDSYGAVVNLKTKTVEVGCQTFDFKTIQALATLTKKEIK